MVKIIGVRFRQAGKIYHFSPGALDIKINDSVIVETSRGMEFGRVVIGQKEIPKDSLAQPLKTVIRIATKADIETMAMNKAKEKTAIQVCREKAMARGLEMKVIDAEFTFDNNKVLFYFTADGRVDFRELVKDLASVFRTRIELRQIGVRDETKILGGIGVCGRELCCNKYLTDFAPVSIKMAKNQNLSLNPTKISGVCGRLMCCLSNEEETYEALNSNLPAVGAKVKCADGTKGEVISISTLKQEVKVMSVSKSGDREFKEYPVGELSFTTTFKEQVKVSADEIDEDVAKLLEVGTAEQLEEKKKNQKRHNGGEKRRPQGDNRARNFDRNKQSDDKREQGNTNEGANNQRKFVSDKTRGERPQGKNRERSQENRKGEDVKRTDGRVRNERKSIHGDRRNQRPQEQRNQDQSNDGNKRDQRSQRPQEQRQDGARRDQRSQRPQEQKSEGQTSEVKRSYKKGY